MSHLSQNLERLIQMISIEQLLGLVKQNNTDNKTNSDILTTPIVQKVVKAYEEELHTLNTVTNPNACVKDYSEDIAKIHEQLASINSNLLHLADAIKNIHISTNVAASLEVDKSSSKVVVASLEDKSLEAVANEVDKSSLASLEEEHVRLKIEEKQVTTTNESDDESSLASLEEEVEEEEVEELEAEEEEVATVASLEEESEKEISDEEVEEESVADEEVEESEEVEEEESEKEISDEESEEEEEVVVLSEAKNSNAVVEDDEEEEEVFEIEIDDVTYYATSEENGILYEVDKDGEVGKKVGIIKDGEPIFS